MKIIALFIAISFAAINTSAQHYHYHPHYYHSHYHNSSSLSWMENLGLSVTLTGIGCMAYSGVEMAGGNKDAGGALAFGLGATCVGVLLLAASNHSGNGYSSIYHRYHPQQEYAALSLAVTNHYADRIPIVIDHGSAPSALH